MSSTTIDEEHKEQLKKRCLKEFIKGFKVIDINEDTPGLTTVTLVYEVTNPTTALISEWSKLYLTFYVNDEGAVLVDSYTDND